MTTYVKVFNKETKTNPVIIHANGKSKVHGKINADSWPVLLNSFRESSPKQNTLRDDLTIVTWKGGKYNNTITTLEESCNKFGVNLTILPWPSHINDFWEASKAKAYETLNAIKTGKIKTKYIMAMDAGDVIFLRHPNEVLDLYLTIYPQFKSVWCTEANDWPKLDLPKYVHYPELDELLIKVSNKDKESIKNHGSRFAFLNSGCVIGETQSLVSFYETGMSICGKLRTADQAMARIAQFLNPDTHGQDALCNIFQCLYDVSLETLDITLVNE